jgi:hypothetical protein
MKITTEDTERLAQQKHRTWPAARPALGGPPKLLIRLADNLQEDVRRYLLREDQSVTRTGPPVHHVG